MTRVCIISEGTYPISIGGVSKWIHSLVSNMPDIEFEIISLVPDTNHKFQYKLPKNVKKIHFWPIWNGLEHNDLENTDTPLNVHTTKKFKQFFKSEINSFSQDPYLNDGFILPLTKIFEMNIPRADIYHAVNSGYAGLIGSLAKNMYSKPLVITEHGSYYKEWFLRLSSVDFPDELNHPKLLQPQDHKQIKLLKFIKKLVSFSFNMADIISPVTNAHIPLEVQLGAAPGKIKVIPNGVDQETFSQLGSADSSGNPDEIVVGTLARVNPIKDVKTLIKAAKLVLDKKPNVRFEYIGPSEDKEYLYELNELIEDLSLENKFNFIPETLTPEDAYSRFSIFALSSISEAQPLAVLEAMSAGLPIVATKVGGVPEPVSGNGLLVEPGDYRGFAKSLLYFVNNPVKTKKISKLAKQKAEYCYSEHAFIKSYRNLYKLFI
ncbi:MAG: GT4 family glycosyltransferase PelF [Candidatus Odinarchaeia archaeon]